MRRAIADKRGALDLDALLAAEDERPQLCVDSCNNSFAAREAKLRGDFLGQLTTCFAGLDCVNARGNDAYTQCASDGYATLSASKTGAEFCDDYQAALAKCGERFFKTDCYDTAKSHNDASIADAESCLNKACSTIDGCVDATFGD